MNLMDVPPYDLTTVTILESAFHLKRSLLTMYPVETCNAVFTQTGFWNYAIQKESCEIIHMLMKVV